MLLKLFRVLWSLRGISIFVGSTLSEKNSNPPEDLTEPNSARLIHFIICWKHFQCRCFSSKRTSYQTFYILWPWLSNMVNLYPCLFCEAVFVHQAHAKDHIRDCHSGNERITITHHEDMNSSLWHVCNHWSFRTYLNCEKPKLCSESSKPVFIVACY